MDKILEFFGFPTEGKGRTWGTIAIVSMLAHVLDLFNLADVMGITKRTLNKFLPSFFKKDKFRPSKSLSGTTKALDMLNKA